LQKTEVSVLFPFLADLSGDAFDETIIAVLAKNDITSDSVPITTSLKVDGRAMASSKLLTGKVYWHGCIEGLLKWTRAPLALK
jgi:hypothetical protein